MDIDDVSIINDYIAKGAAPGRIFTAKQKKNLTNKRKWQVTPTVGKIIMKPVTQILLIS